MCGFASGAHARELVHQRLVDVQPARGVDDHDVAVGLLRSREPVAHGLHRVGALGRVDGDVDLLAELLELLDRGGALEVRGDERGLAAFLAQQQRELRRGGRLAGALEAGEQDHRRRPPGERELRRARAHQRGQLLVDDLHDLLAGRQALGDVLADGPLAHLLDEVLDDLEVDVGLEQREADLPHRAGDRFVVEPPLLAKVAEGALEPV